jgi:hypothetical protein
MRRGGPGRPKGRANKTTLEAMEFCASIVDDPVYQRAIRVRALNGELVAALEAMLWHYAKGKPKEQVAVEGRQVEVFAVDHVLGDWNAEVGAARALRLESLMRGRSRFRTQSAAGSVGSRGIFETDVARSL